MSAERYQLLARLLQKQGINYNQEDALLPSKEEGFSPLSWGQERLWFFDRLVPRSALYNVPLRISIKGSLEVPLVEQCLNEIVRRHAVLRATFIVQGAEVYQQITPTLHIPLQCIDLQHLLPADQESAVQAFSERESSQPFDLDQGPLLRTSLLTLGTNKYLLFFTVHHIVFDGWSQGIFLREFTMLYQAYQRGETSPLADLSIQYTDYVRWQRQQLQGSILDEHLTACQQRLAGVPTILDLPTDYARPHLQTFSGNRHEFTLPPTLTERLESFGQQMGCSLFMTLLAAFEILLYRYSGQEDFVVGTPITERSRNEAAELIGFFVNTLPLRADFTKQPTGRQLLERVRQDALDAFAYQALPFEKLVERLQPVRDPSRSPIVQVLFVLQQETSHDLELPGLVLDLQEYSADTAKFDLLMELQETPEGLVVHLEYNTDLFAAATIARMGGHFQTVLEGLLTAPDLRISELPLLTDAEQHQLLIAWNETKQAYPVDRCLHELFEEQAASTPDAVAVIFGEEQITYQDLHRKAMHLAEILQQRGVGPEVVVGLYLERSPEMIVSMLGILKAGGAYVPLDPAYPGERLAFILQDAGVHVLITQEALRNNLPTLSELKLYVVETGWTDHPLSSLPLGTRKTPAVIPAHLAYVIYTSGSTGQPKGVQIEHRNAVALLAWARDFFTPQALAGVLASSSICFDLSIFEIFAPLICGGTVILATNILQLLSLTPSRPITLINTAPSVANELITYASFPATVQVVNFAGEPLPGSVVQKCAHHEGIQRIINLYGPSETTTYSTVAHVSKEEREPCIGYPIANTQIYVLDAHLQPVPIGVPGELYIGGAGVTRGYWQRPGLTAERFIPNPFSTQSSARLYKTGDLVRYLPDGQLQFLRRNDHQVKLRGFRIEPGEIEVTLNQHAAIHESIVLLREDAPAEKHLVAYLLLRSSDTLGQIEQAQLFEDLRSFLRERLPEYMVPAVFQVLASWPLTPNGKLNYLALPVPRQQFATVQPTSVHAYTEVEQKILQLWRELLGFENMGINDNFFDLGGHSLLLVRLHNELQKQFHREIPLLKLFQYTTISSLAHYLEEDQVHSPSLQHRYDRAERRRESLQRPGRSRNGQGM